MCRVDDLKIFTDEEIADMAFKEAFKVYGCHSLFYLLITRIRFVHLKNLFNRVDYRAKMML